MIQQSSRTDETLSLNATPGRSRWAVPGTLLYLADDLNTDLIMDLIEIFCSDIPRRLTQVRDALRDCDHKGIRDRIHSIKGSAQQMGADGMARMCLDIETAASEVPTGQLSERVERLEAEFAVVCREMSETANAFASRSESLSDDLWMMENCPDSQLA